MFSIKRKGDMFGSSKSGAFGEITIQYMGSEAASVTCSWEGDIKSAFTSTNPAVQAKVAEVEAEMVETSKRFQRLFDMNKAGLARLMGGATA